MLSISYDKGGLTMAKLRSRYRHNDPCNVANFQLEFFPRSLVFTSMGAYEAIFIDASDQFGEFIRKITEDLLSDVAISNDQWHEKITIRKKLQLDFIVKSVLVKHNKAEVIALVYFPIINCPDGIVADYLGEVLRRVGVENARFNGTAWEIAFMTKECLVGVLSNGSGLINHDVMQIFITRLEYKRFYLDLCKIAN
jgi:hypothetical protein